MCVCVCVCVGDQEEGLESSGEGVKSPSLHHKCSFHYAIPVSPRSRVSIPHVNCMVTFRFLRIYIILFPHSRYVKYLYPYECEIENLSDPQELQVAIDSHKRDRRQSDTVDFMHQSLPSARAATLDSLTPVTSHVTAAAATPQGLQILSSPTVALPHGAIPPYSGSFIVTGPGGAQMVTPQISGPPQLVQMTTPHGIPIMVPALTPGKTVAEQLAGGRGGTAVGAGGGEGDDRDDVSSQASSEASDRESSAPPLKRVAVDIGGRVVPTTRIPSVATATPGFMMAPAGRLVPTSHFASPHVVQVGPSPHIPIVMPTTTATGFVSQTSSPMETGIGNGMVVKDDGSRRSPLENGGCSPHLVSTATGKRTVISASNLLPQSHSSHPLPLILPSTIAVGHHGNSKHRSSEPSSLHSDRSHVDHTHSSMAMEKPHSKHNGGVGVVSTAIPIKPSIANIAIQSGVYYIRRHGCGEIYCVCVCACVHVCVCVCVRACVLVCVCACVRRPQKQVSLLLKWPRCSGVEVHACNSGTLGGTPSCLERSLPFRIYCNPRGFYIHHCFLYTPSVLVTFFGFLRPAL